nr:S-layer homology domain-containing protein [Lysinibacillus timonensis]
MKKVPKIMTILGLTSGILLYLVGSVSANTVHYKDVNETDNYYNSVKYLLEQKAISRTLPNFRPYEHITRGQFASIFAKVLGDAIRPAALIFFDKFKDVPRNNQFHEYIIQLYSTGYMNGYGDGRFGINDPLTRGQMAGILIKVYNIPLISNDDYKESGGVESDIFDGTNFKGQWGRHIATLNYLNILGGFGDGNFKPNNSINRSQLANMLTKIHTKMEHADFIYDGELKYRLRTFGVSEGDISKTLSSIRNSESGTDVLKFVSEYDMNGLPNDETIMMHFEIYREGEVLFEDINAKLVTKREKNNWLIYFEKVENETGLIRENTTNQLTTPITDDN